MDGTPLDGALRCVRTHPTKLDLAVDLIICVYTVTRKRGDTTGVNSTFARSLMTQITMTIRFLNH
jgi:hypothetical protein